MVPQETVLFSGTIYDNLILANPHASFQQVIQACKMAEIHEVIERLPEGYQTAIGEHGVGLSGGQRQRLAIARALLKRPRVLIFDEATANLDQETAEAFARTVNQLKGRVTMLFIAHQLPRALQVDEVVRLGAPQEPIAPVRPAAADAGEAHRRLSMDATTRISTLAGRQARLRARHPQAAGRAAVAARRGCPLGAARARRGWRSSGRRSAGSTSSPSPRGGSCRRATCRSCSRPRRGS